MRSTYQETKNISWVTDTTIEINQKTQVNRSLERPCIHNLSLHSNNKDKKVRTNIK